MHYLSYVGFGDDSCIAVAIRADGRVALAGDTNSTAFPTTSGAFQGTLGGSWDAWVGVFDLIPNNVTRIGAGSGACPGIDMQISAMPAPGATIELICNDTPPAAVGPAGALFIGTPLLNSLPILGVELWVLPLIALPVNATAGSARNSLTIPPSAPAFLGIGFQYVWLATPGCPNAGPLAASDALAF